MRNASETVTLITAAILAVSISTDAPISQAQAGDLTDDGALRTDDAFEYQAESAFDFRYRYLSAAETNHLEFREQFYESPCAKAGELVDQYIGLSFTTDEKGEIPIEAFIAGFWDVPTEDLVEEVGTLSCHADGDAGATEFADEQMRTAVLSRKFFSAPTYSQSLEMIRRESAGLSPEAKSRLMQMFGSIYFCGYDLSRSWANRGELPMVDIFEASQSRILGAAPEANAAGICGDLAMASGEIAHAMGYRNVHIIGYDTPNGTPHAALYFEDPGDPRKSYRQNYEAQSHEDAVDGAAALYQGDNLFNSDVTLKYRVYDQRGHIVHRVPSELQTTLVEVLRGESAVEDLSPGHLQGGNLSSASLHRNIAGVRSAGKLYGAIDGQGRSYLGIGICGNRDILKGINLDGGVSGTRLMSHNIDSDLVFSYLEMRANSPNLAPGDGTQAHVYALSTISTLVGRVGREYEGCDGAGNYALYEDHGWGRGGFGWARSMDGRIKAGLRTKIGEENGPVRFTLDGSGEWNPAWDHTQPTQDAEFRFFFNQAVLDVRAICRLGPTRSDGNDPAGPRRGRAFLIGNARCIVDHFGQRIIVGGGVRRGGTQVELDYRGRVESDSPLFREASFRQAGARVQQSFGRNMHVSARALIPLEKGRGLRFGVGAYLGRSPMN